jgi:PRTRC genetic system ThiF family protein
MPRKHRKFRNNNQRQERQPQVAKPEIMPALDLSMLNAATIHLPQFDSFEIAIAGCGGTGSFMAMHAARLTRVLYGLGKRGHLTLLDPDIVEEGNIGRQLFCDAEVGQPKALALARRYGFAWGVNTTYAVDKYDEKYLNDADITILVGCVDGAEGRRALNETLSHNDDQLPFPPSYWWLDCGNVQNSGRVLLGSAYSIHALAAAFPEPNVCAALPSPAHLYPDLLDDQPEELANNNLSCAEMLMANQQSFDINASIAVEASKFLTSLLLKRNLKRFACEVNNTSGVVKPTSYATPEEVARIIKKPVSYVQRLPSAFAASNAA